MPSQSPDAKSPHTDVNWINSLASQLSIGGRGEALQTLIELFIADCILDADPQRTCEQRKAAVAEEIKERLRCCRSHTYSHEMFSMAAHNDPDFDEFLFPDGREEMVFIADSVIENHAEFLLMRYIDYIDTYRDYELTHPSDFSGPKEADEDKEWERLIRDFSFMLKEWRDDFLCKLIEDCAAKAPDS